MGGLAQLGLISVLVCSISLSSASPHEYDSVIKAGVHTSYWCVYARVYLQQRASASKHSGRPRQVRQHTAFGAPLQGRHKR